MNTAWIYAITLLTHIPGWIYWMQLSGRDAWILGTSLLASSAMHLSETKHQLPGMIGSSWSNELLCLDRMTAVLLALYIAAHVSAWTPSQITMGMFLSLCAMLGEWTDGIGYAILHGIWHVGIFSLAGQILWESQDVSPRWITASYVFNEYTLSILMTFLLAMLIIPVGWVLWQGPLDRMIQRRPELGMVLRGY